MNSNYEDMIKTDPEALSMLHMAQVPTEHVAFVHLKMASFHLDTIDYDERRCCGVNFFFDTRKSLRDLLQEARLRGGLGHDDARMDDYLFFESRTGPPLLDPEDGSFDLSVNDHLKELNFTDCALSSDALLQLSSHPSRCCNTAYERGLSLSNPNRKKFYRGFLELAHFAYDDESSNFEHMDNFEEEIGRLCMSKLNNAKKRDLNQCNCLIRYMLKHRVSKTIMLCASEAPFEVLSPSIAKKRHQCSHWKQVGSLEVAFGLPAPATTTAASLSLNDSSHQKVQIPTTNWNFGFDQIGPCLNRQGFLVVTSSLFKKTDWHEIIGWLHQYFFALVTYTALVNMDNVPRAIIDVSSQVTDKMLLTLYKLFIKDKNRRKAFCSAYVYLIGELKYPFDVASNADAIKVTGIVLFLNILLNRIDEICEELAHKTAMSLVQQEELAKKRKEKRREALMKKRQQQRDHQREQQRKQQLQQQQLKKKQQQQLKKQYRVKKYISVTPLSSSPPPPPEEKEEEVEVKKEEEKKEITRVSSLKPRLLPLFCRRQTFSGPIRQVNEWSQYTCFDPFHRPCVNFKIQTKYF